MLRGRDVQDIEELKRQGLSIRAISALTGYDRKTIRKYLIQPESTPVYGPRPVAPSKLDAFKPYLDERLKAGVWNAQVLLRELRARGYPGGYTAMMPGWSPVLAAHGSGPSPARQGVRIYRRPENTRRGGRTAALIIGRDGSRSHSAAE